MGMEGGKEVESVKSDADGACLVLASVWQRSVLWLQSEPSGGTLWGFGVFSSAAAGPRNENCGEGKEEKMGNSS